MTKFIIGRSCCSFLSSQGNAVTAAIHFVRSTNLTKLWYLDCWLSAALPSLRGGRRSTRQSTARSIWVASAFLIAAGSASAQENDTNAEPKIELGVGIAVQSLRDYRGSTEHQTNALPFPYIVYRGEFIELDRDSAKGKIFSSDKIELAVSADASYTEDSKNNALRVDMEPLDPTFELGPSLEVNLTGEDLDQGWLARFPIRGVFAVDVPNIRQVGWLANPKLTYKHPDLWNNTNFKFDAGLVYGDSDYHQYLYGVPSEDATITRPEYEAQSGYSGAFVKFGLDRRIDNWWLKGYVRYDNLSGIENSDSPLFETDHYVSVGLAVAWVFWESME